VSTGEPTEPPRALAGVRSSTSPPDVGPYASLVLGDFGADIIKIESAPKGDGCRYIGTLHRWRVDDVPHVEQEQAQCLSRLRRPEGSPWHFASSTRPTWSWRTSGRRRRQDRDRADAVLERNPRVIYCSVNAFGSRAWALRPDRPRGPGDERRDVGDRRTRRGPLLVGIPSLTTAVR